MGAIMITNPILLEEKYFRQGAASVRGGGGVERYVCGEEGRRGYRDEEPTSFFFLDTLK